MSPETELKNITEFVYEHCYFLKKPIISDINKINEISDKMLGINEITNEFIMYFDQSIESVNLLLKKLHISQDFKI